MDIFEKKCFQLQLLLSWEQQGGRFNQTATIQVSTKERKCDQHKIMETLDKRDQYYIYTPVEMCEKNDKSQIVGIDCHELNRFGRLYIHTSKIVAKSVNQNQLN